MSVVTPPFKFWFGIGVSSLGGFFGWNSDSSSAFLLGLLLLHSIVVAVNSVSELLLPFAVMKCFLLLALVVALLVVGGHASVRF